MYVCRCLDAEICRKVCSLFEVQNLGLDFFKYLYQQVRAISAGSKEYGMYFSVHERGLFYNFEILSFRSDKRNLAVLPTFFETMTSKAFDVNKIVHPYLELA
jgi:hypothetical protein